MKDNFSGHAADYAKYRPQYSTELISYLVSLAPAQHLAWDCATGNGQMAGMLSEHFAEVVATDMSEKQIQNAVPMPNITYKVEPAEQSTLADASVDFVVVAQAVHWFEFDKFYKEVKRVLRSEGVLALVGYGLISVSSEVDKVLQELYEDILGEYWDPERRYIDAAYKTIPFPFQELEVPELSIQYTWTVEDIINYLNTWSAVKHYEKKQHQNPVQLIERELREVWPQQQADIKFNIIARVGKV
ncbi:class I SAM-dependent methyltransferase [Pontibacter rugosus]|uniref:Class I SAM-dependent methyltransferase n=1 Tax=Pontibacter rugosus TaxID=1745966 RepID=A0ABW3SQ59_9BACT